MKIETKIRLKIFFTFSLVMVFIIAIQFYPKNGIILWLLIALSVLGGAIMSWILIKIHKNAIISTGRELNDTEFKVHHREVIRKEIPIQMIYDTLKSDKIVKIWKLSIDNNTIQGQTKRSWQSFGEQVKIVCVNNEITIESKSKIKTTLLDYGKNRSNVVLLKKLIETIKLQNTIL